MSILGNILWLIFGGFVSALGWFFVGVIWCITIIGIPLGMQCFKFAALMLSPFGSDIAYEGGTGSTIINVIWLLLGGIELALMHAAIGALLCITIVGIPFGRQHFKFVRLALLPVGSRVI